MASWRDTASELTQHQIDLLVGTGLQMAEEQVVKHGEFYPFLLAFPHGALEPDIVMATDGSDRPDSTELIATLTEGVRARREELVAYALVSDLFINGTPAAAVAVEHRDGIWHGIYRGYKPKRFGRGATLGGLGGFSTKPQVWIPAA